MRGHIADVQLQIAMIAMLRDNRKINRMARCPAQIGY